MAWTTAPSDWLTTSYAGDEWGNISSPLTQYAPYMQQQQFGGGGENITQQWMADIDAWSAAQQAQLPEGTVGTTYATYGSGAPGEGSFISGAPGFATANQDQWNQFQMLDFLGYDQGTKDALWNFISNNPENPYAAEMIKSGSQFGDPLSAMQQVDPTAGWSPYAGGWMNFLSDANQYGNIGFDQGEYDRSKAFSTTGGHFAREQEENTTFTDFMIPLTAAIMAIGSGGVMGGAAGAAAAAATTAAQAAQGQQLGGQTIMGGLTSGAGSVMAPALAGGIGSELAGAGLDTTLSNIAGKAGSSALMSGISSGGDLESMGLSALTGGAGAGLNEVIGSTSGDSAWGVNPQSGEGAGMFEDMYDPMMGDSLLGGTFTGDSTMWNDPMTGGDMYGNTSMDPTAAMDTSLAPDASFNLQSGTTGGTGSLSLTSLLPLLQKLFLGGGGTTSGTGGTTGGTGGTTSGGTTSGSNLGLLDMLGGIYNYNTLNDQSSLLKQLMGQAGTMDPYAQYRPSEAAMRNQTFMDPLSIYNSQPYQLLDQRMQDQQLAKDAQAGQLFNAPERLAQRQTGFLDYLSKLRGDLLPGSGAGMSPGMPLAFQSEVAKTMTPIELAKARAVGQATQAGTSALPGTVSTIEEILRMIGGSGGAGV